MTGDRAKEALVTGAKIICSIVINTLTNKEIMKKIKEDFEM